MSEDTVKIYLELPDELQQLLNDNNVSINEIMRQEKIEGEVTYGVIPEQTEETERSKELVTIILASSAAVMLIVLAISRVLHTLQRKPHLVEYYELMPIKDAKGKILLDKEGKPQLLRQKKYELLEPRKADSKQQFEAKFNAKDGLVIRFGAADKQMETPTTKGE